MDFDDSLEPLMVLFRLIGIEFNYSSIKWKLRRYFVSLYNVLLFIITISSNLYAVYLELIKGKCHDCTSVTTTIHLNNTLIWISVQYVTVGTLLGLHIVTVTQWKHLKKVMVQIANQFELGQEWYRKLRNLCYAGFVFVLLVKKSFTASYHLTKDSLGAVHK